MEDFKYLQRLRQIDNHNMFIDYIVNRVLSDEYRGIQCSQHNRLTFPYFSKLIEAIYDIAGDERFDIHVGDDNGELQPSAHKYYAVVEKIKSSSGKGTINSVKKNTFPDIARMGFLLRYDRSGILISESVERASVYSVQLSEKGLDFYSGNQMKRMKMFSDGIDKITSNICTPLTELLQLNDYGIEHIDLKEFMYIISDKRPDITLRNKISLLVEYRRLSYQQKVDVDSLLKEFCNPLNRKQYKNKILLRDYNNWKNESQQIYGLLASSVYFKIANDRLILNNGNMGIFDENTTRSERVKKEYLKLHNISKTAGYAMHHIVPFTRAENKSQSLLIDNVDNLIYLKNEKHDEFTSLGTKNVILRTKKDDPHVLFFDFKDDYIRVDIRNDALINPSFLPQMQKYNESLLKRFYYA